MFPPPPADGNTYNNIVWPLLMPPGHQPLEHYRPPADGNTPGHQPPEDDPPPPADGNT